LWADDVAHALSLIGAASESNDFVVASGTTSTLDDFTRLACAEFGLDPGVVLTHDPSLVRPREIQSVQLDPSHINKDLRWTPLVDFPELVSRLVRNEP
jgi:GDPmannose 4,6-dehydratase